MPTIVKGSERFLSMGGCINLALYHRLGGSLWGYRHCGAFVIFVQNKNDKCPELGTDGSIDIRIKINHA